MADRPISDLTTATQIKDNDLFVLQQDESAKSLAGNTLKQYLNRATGVTNVEKIGTSHLVDTYRISYNNTSSEFDVTNGKSITGISKTSSSSTYDTYTITYNDGEPTTFTVPYGKDCTASVATTYAGSSSATSIPASSYWKTSVSSAIDYYQIQASQSIKGHYVWTRNITSFNTGGSNTSYSVAYQGLDGVATREVLVITGSITSLPKTITNIDIEANMVCVESYLSNPNVQASDWSVSTSNGSLTISGTYYGTDTTTITLYLMQSR